MPTVPAYEGPQVTPTSLHPGQLGAPDSQSVAGQQALHMGRALTNLGAHGAAIATDIQNEANKTVAKDIDTQVFAAAEIRRNLASTT